MRCPHDGQISKRAWSVSIHRTPFGFCAGQGFERPAGFDQSNERHIQISSPACAEGPPGVLRRRSTWGHETYSFRPTGPNGLFRSVRLGCLAGRIQRQPGRLGTGLVTAKTESVGFRGIANASSSQRDPGETGVSQPTSRLSGVGFATTSGGQFNHQLVQEFGMRFCPGSDSPFSSP